MSTVRYLPTDYIYSSARLRAREMLAMRHTYLLQLAEKKDAAELVAALVGDGVLHEGAAADFDGALDTMVREEFDLVCACLPQPQALAFLRYPADCHNLKVALKCHYRGIEPVPFFDKTGSVDTALLSGLPHAAHEAIPAHMREAIAKARKAYEQNGDPRVIDFMLDAACFADMAAQTSDMPLAQELVRARADITNLCTARRLLAMHLSSGEGTLTQAFVPGGALALEEVLTAFRGGESALRALADKGAYRGLFDGEDADADRFADSFYAGIANSAKALPFGIEIAVCYLQGLLTAAKNLRILYTAKKTGVPQDALAGRLRESYV